MVVFTCAYCGESVKKNQVVKHHQITRCRNNLPALTCVDCLKDFNGDEYIAHTSCVTEEERYSAKGFVSKPPADKGKKKQDNWLHFIREIVDSCAVDEKVNRLLKCIAKESGVPQKKPKFLNFCANKFRFGNLALFEHAWEFLEKKKEEMKITASAENGDQIKGVSCNGQEDRKRKRIDSNNDSLTDSTERKEECDVSKGSCGNLSKKKKKQKQDKQETNIESQQKVQIVHSNVEEKSKKKKKSNFENHQNGDVNESVEQETIGDEVEAQETEVKESEYEQSKHVSKKEKKEKRKREKYEKQLLEIQNQPTHAVEDEEQINNVEVKDKSKKKKKHPGNGAIEDLEQIVVKTVSKKKHMYSDSEKVAVEKREDIEDQEVTDKKPAKFNWEETVVAILESKGELPLKRVEKKVVNEYMNSAVHLESIEKVIAKFNKKIMKMSKVKVQKEVVKLVS